MIILDYPTLIREEGINYYSLILLLNDIIFTSYVTNELIHLLEQYEYPSINSILRIIFISIKLCGKSQKYYIYA